MSVRPILGFCALALACALPRAALAEHADLPALAQAGAAKHARPEGVHWFEGDVDAAFASARASHKPVFLYWGALWCPPCQELKATIFQRPDFLQRLELFVSVYLDGDSAGAQAWGEKFAVIGYPTVLVLRDDRAEIERVSGGMDLSRYAEVLDLAMKQMRPARDVLVQANRTETTLSARDCRQLAYNGWQLDDAWIFHPESLDGLARDLAHAAKHCPLKLRAERARLRTLAALAALQSQEKALGSGKAAVDPLPALVREQLAILGDRPTALQVGEVLEELPPPFFALALQASGGEKARAKLRGQWFAVMDAMAGDGRRSQAEQFYSLRGKLVGAKALDPEGRIAPELAQSVSQRIDSALAQERDPYRRTSLVNAALNVLDVLGDEQRAHEILAGEMKTSAYPYYYMSDLAEIEEKRGNKAGAIELLARAYQTAEGPATRFQWGAGYVRGLVRMAPQDEAAIRGAAESVLAELDASGDLHGRTRRALERLGASLSDWNHDGSHTAAIAALRSRRDAICARIPEQDTGRAACTAFLAPA
jgi:thiol-disulfide isomerase/thioredoxin